MSQNAEREEALRKVRTFSQQTTERGRTEAEMNFALDKMQKLMTAFKITMDEVAISSIPCISVSVDTGSAIDQPIGGVARAIAEYCDCIYYRNSGVKTLVRDSEGQPVYKDVRRKLRNGRVKYSRIYKMDKGNISYVFFGQEQDARMAEFLFKMIAGSLEAETQAFKKTPAYKLYSGAKKRASHSFQHGMIARVAQRIEEMANQQMVEVEAETPQGHDLMVIKDERVEKEFKTTGITLRNRKTSRRVTSSSSYGQGSKAGDRVNLSRPVGNDDTTLLIG